MMKPLFLKVPGLVFILKTVFSLQCCRLLGASAAVYLELDIIFLETIIYLI